jgi:hypothetical protein
LFSFVTAIISLVITTMPLIVRLIFALFQAKTIAPIKQTLTSSYAKNFGCDKNPLATNSHIGTGADSDVGHELIEK